MGHVDDWSQFPEMECGTGGEPHQKPAGYEQERPGRIYKTDPENLVGSIEEDLLKERKIYRNAMDDIYLNIIPKIKEKLGHT